MLKLRSRQTEMPITRRRANWLAGIISSLVLIAVATILLAPRQPPALLPTVALLPRLNAILNSASVLVLSAGYLFIRRKRVRLHRICMLSAFVLSILFLISYVTYHAAVGSTPFDGPNWARPIYYPVLVSHIMLAMFLLPLSLVTLHRAWHQMLAQHRRLAPWTLVIWIYVSVTGVVVYWMLYHLSG